ncbi:mucin-5AC isoform X2 [Athalia rosae]|uniref:mucin-5AC isoform X2 n=1 Tax=Athalia rosae TaxID=37344 RepID=UPI002033A9E5|nr:mucin-5AC isoform X2 [Athalia rosae]
MGPKLMIIFCAAAGMILSLGNCEDKVLDDDQRARLPEFLTELDLASLEASKEDVESLKKIVKRLAPAKNGVMGQPGVDFPVLTTIPATKFSCRGLKGGYYADLETNCQVFHICDNGRKISFLCPNGTIFQQSQLICDWWFKVDCGKSAELYEQSAEQLAEEDRKRADARKMNSEFHRPNGKEGGQAYYQNQNENVDYDGKQNGRTNPFGQNQAQNAAQVQSVNENGERVQVQNGRNGNQFGQGQATPSPQLGGDRGNQNQNYNHQASNGQLQSNRQNSNNKLFNQEDNKGGNNRGQFTRQNFNYNTRSGNNRAAQNSQEHFGASSNSNGPRDEKSSYRSPKGFSDVRNSYNEITTVANPFKEYQQLAESAAFATSRNNRYNKSYQYNQFGNYYSSNQLGSSTEKYSANEAGNNVAGGRQSNNQKGSPFPTFTPIYKPRTTTSTSTTPSPKSTTTQKSYVNTDVYRQSNNEAAQTPSYFGNAETTVAVTENSYRSETPKVEGVGDNSLAVDYRQNSDTRSVSYPQSFPGDTDNNPSTLKPYVNTDTYRYGNGGNTAITEAPTTTWTSYDRSPTTAPTATRSASTGEVYPGESGNSEGTTLTPTTTQRYGDNYELGNSATGTTTYYEDRQKWKNAAAAGTTSKSSGGERRGKSYSQGGRASNLNTFEATFGSKNGKVAPTLGPYVPFTRNYAYTTTTTTSTRKPPVYTATVPTIPANRKFNGITTTTTTTTTETPAYFTTPNPTSVKNSQAEREHAIDMLQSLRELEGTPSTDDNQNGSRAGLNIPPSSGPSTLHTLALYFATASDNFDDSGSNETATDVAVRVGGSGDEGEKMEEPVVTTENPSAAELPSNLLTQHTLNSYADLFNINSALQPKDNGSVDSRVAQEEEESEAAVAAEDYSLKDDAENDLDIQQSQGPVSGTNAVRSNNPKLRELAQVFTHALSAYLQDPDTFRKVLTEIRPTEPPTTSYPESTDTTVTYPTTQEEYPSATKEKDEVLDFSDVTKSSRRKKLTTPYPTFTTPLETTYQTYYTTSESARYREGSVTAPNFGDEALNEAQSSDFRSSDDAKRNDIAHEVNHAFTDSNANDVRVYGSDPSGPSAPQSEYDSYAVVGENPSENRYGGFQNNSATTSSPYGKDVMPADATPIGDNYVPESTPASYFQNQDTTVGNYRSPKNLVTSVTNEDFATFNAERIPTTTTAVPGYQENEVVTSSTGEPFRINYYDAPTPKATKIDDESLVTAGSVYSTFKNNFNDLRSGEKTTERTQLDAETTTTDYPPTTENRDNDGQRYAQQTSAVHWTASPLVTRLWETTVFLDPKRINQGLTGTAEESTSSVTETFGTTPISRQEILVTDASGVGKTSQYNGVGITDSPWKWTPNENDSPTAFTLLPTAYSPENTATPPPTYTTHSSIITTITSSVSAMTKQPAVTSSRKEKSSEPLIVNVKTFNVTENEIIRAQEMFGNLNASSTNTLMRVMKQADNNSTVRQLVLLLISHCKGPMNKTMEEEKEQLLDALLRMPVNEFSSEESRDIIAGIHKLQLPIGRPSSSSSSSSVSSSSVSSATSVEEPATAPSTTTSVSVTTYRSRRGRKFRTSTEDPKPPTRSGDGDNSQSGNSLSIEAGSPSDNRALELLRSLYTIAAKWG